MNCLAVFFLPEGQSFEAALTAAGWRLGEAGHRCPGCVNGAGPVLERGECPRCCGSTVDLPQGAVCHYCGHLVPHPAADEDDEDEGDLTDVG
ncbi:hypothetical protein GCM10009564_32920 [Streptomyces thermogriseus]|uniref:Uncharacterized protein n=1 Tax=Streptomyces thermogriseus TaxID=75292 RepID=A0ABN1T1G5_9ACTN